MKRRPTNVRPPKCPYCGQPAEFMRDSSSLYRGRDMGPVWICRKDKAWVGTHKNSKQHKPLGSLANADLRRLRNRAHAAFDDLWKRKIARDGCAKNEARAAGYKWLAAQLCIDPKQCHVGMFDVEQCQRTILACLPYQRRRDPAP